MKLTFYRRIFLTLVPHFALLAVLGGAGVVLLSQLGAQIDKILQDNYDSIVATERLNEALERVDSSFHFTLAGHEEQGREQYLDNWKRYRTHLEREQKLVFVPGEAALVERLTALTDRYQHQGDSFFARPRNPGPKEAYFGEEGRSGLLTTFREIKDVTAQIISLNRQNMEHANRDARETAKLTLIWFGVGLATALVLAVLLALYTVRAIRQPVLALTQSTLAIGSGNLDQVVPITSEDELGQLACAFNTMARQLRAYGQLQTSQLLRARQCSQAAIDSFPQPVIVVDLTGRVEMANPAAQQALGVMAGATELTAAECGNRLPRQVMTPHDLLLVATAPPGDDPSSPAARSDHRLLPEALLKPLVEALRDHRSYLPKDLDQAIRLRCEAQDAFFLPRILPIADPHGNALGAAVMLEDVTQFRLLNQLKTDLVATASHELKTPLATIRLAIHWLLDGTLGPLTPSQEEVTLEARDNAERLLMTMNSLLDLARLEQGRQSLDLQPEQPLALLQAAREARRLRAEEKGVEVVVEAPADLPMVQVDSEAFSHVLHNLIDNAMAYTDRAGRITLAASSSGDAVTLSVADTGIGIPPEYTPHLFDKFFRVPGQPRGSGTGLGLAITREIVTAHGGTISCDSQPGKGTVFRVTLPVWSADATELENSVNGKVATL
jgi:NtrC-family two-component system sensor histidine kinase KinB